MIKKHKYKFLIVLFSILVALYIYLPRTQKEGFLNFGNTDTTKNFLSAVSQTVSDTMISVSQECQNSSKFDNSLNVSCSPSDLVQKAYLDAKTACTTAAFNKNLDPSVACPDTSYSPCVVSNIKQEQVVSFKSNCKLSNDTINNFISQVGQNLTNKMNNTTDAFGGALLNLTNAVKNAGDSGNKTDTEIKQDIVNNVKNSITADVANKMMNNFTASNQLSVNGTGFIVKDVLQKMTLDIITEAMSNNQNLNKILTDADQSSSKETTNTVKGITDIFGSLFSIWGVLIIVGIIFILGIVYFIL